MTEVISYNVLTSFGITDRIMV